MFTVGVTVTEPPVKAPGFQVYEVAPEPVSVAELPAQIAVGEELAPIVGVAVTFKFTVALPVQFSEEVPTTVYTVVTSGDTVTVAPERFPGFQVYVDAPLAFKVAVFPEHKIKGVLVVVTVGTGFTNTKTVFVPIHPDAT